MTKKREVAKPRFPFELEALRLIQYRSKTISNGNFIPVPLNVMRASKLTVQARLLCALLNAYALNKSAFPSRSRLSRDMGIGERAVADYIKELKDAGLITTERRGLGKTNLYFIEEITDELLNKIGTEMNIETEAEQVEPENENDMKTDMQNVANQDMQNVANQDRQNFAHYKDIKEKDIKPEKKKDIKPEKESETRKRKTADEISIARVEDAENGKIDWQTLSNRDFTLFFIREHNERFPTKPLLFDKYSSVGLIRDSFIGLFKLEAEQVCKFIRDFLNAYSNSPDCWGGITWGMIAKNPTLLKRIAGGIRDENSKSKYSPKTNLGSEIEDEREIW